MSFLFRSAVVVKNGSSIAVDRSLGSSRLQKGVRHDSHPRHYTWAALSTNALAFNPSYQGPYIMACMQSPAPGTVG
jgi:hypothetical protein